MPINNSPVHTIGHSNHAIAVFLEMLRSHGIETLVDIRSVPNSRYNQQFRQEALRQALQESGITYHHMQSLGGKRPARKDSPNLGFRQGGGFQGYADYMQTPAFDEALKSLIALSDRTRCAIMCAEKLPENCHRSLVSDALSMKAVQVLHIMPGKKSMPHIPTPFLTRKGDGIYYPSPKLQGDLFV